MEFRTLRHDEVERWLDHCGEVFHATGREYFVKHYRNDPRTDNDDIFVAVDGSEIASTVRVFRREIYLHGKAVGMGGIGEVSTKERYRRQGLSGKLLEMAIERMKQTDLPVSTLYTGVNGHYAKYGWITHDKYTVKVSVENAPLPAGFSMREAHEGDWACIRALYDLYAPRFNGAIVREDPAYWNWVRAENKHTLVLVRNDNVCAYICPGDAAEKDGEMEFAVREFAAAPDFEELLPVVLASATGMLSLPSVARMPAPMWKWDNLISTDKSEALMVRLNKPFMLGEMIDAPQKLLDAFTGPLLFSADSF